MTIRKILILLVIMSFIVTFINCSHATKEPNNDIAENEQIESGVQLNFSDEYITTAEFVFMMADVVNEVSIQHEIESVNQYVQGTEEEKEEELISRGQAATILVKILEELGEDGYPYDIWKYQQNIIDIHNREESLILNILKVYVKGLMEIDAKGRFNVGGGITKEEVKSIRQRIIEPDKRKIPMWISPEFEEKIAIEELTVPQGVFFSGEQVYANIILQNVKDFTETLWIGYSFQDQNKKWYDVPAVPITLNPYNAVSKSLVWDIPEEMMTGKYRVVLAVWDKSPDEHDAVRIAHGEVADGLMLYTTQEMFDAFNDAAWHKSTSRLGRSRLQKENVKIKEGRLVIRLPANSVDGGEIRTQDLQSFGAYEIRMKLPDAPSSITGFFLYKAPDYDHEIDIEVFNNERGELLLTTYANNKKQHEYVGELTFDPTEKFHNYRIEYYPEYVAFYIDNRLIQKWTDGYSDEPMYLMVNSWYPNWLPGQPPEIDKYLYIEWIRY